MGVLSGFFDQEYKEAASDTAEDHTDIFSGSDITLRMNKPPIEEFFELRENCIHISYMEMIPRSTRAQKLDALSSHANLAGYVAVIIAAERLDAVFP